MKNDKKWHKKYISHSDNLHQYVYIKTDKDKEYHCFIAWQSFVLMLHVSSLILRKNLKENLSLISLSGLGKLTFTFYFYFCNTRDSRRLRKNYKKFGNFFYASNETKIVTGLVANIPTIIFFFRFGLTSLYMVLFSRFPRPKTCIFWHCLKSEFF